MKLNARGDIRHEFVLYYVIFFILWFVILSPLLAQAQYSQEIGQQTPWNISNASTVIALNNSSLESMQQGSYWAVNDWFGHYVNLHLDVLLLDVLVFGVFGIYAIYVTVSHLGWGG